MKKISVSKTIAISILAADILLSAATLGLCYLSVIRNYNGSLPYLTALIGLYQGATGYVLGKYMDKSKAENTKGGIVYDTTINNDRDC